MARTSVGDRRRTGNNKLGTMCRAGECRGRAARAVSDVKWDIARCEGKARFRGTGGVYRPQGGAAPLLQTAVDPGGTIIVVFLAGGGGLLLLMHPAKTIKAGMITMIFRNFTPHISLNSLISEKGQLA